MRGKKVSSFSARLFKSSLIGSLSSMFLVVICKGISIELLLSLRLNQCLVKAHLMNELRNKAHEQGLKEDMLSAKCAESSCCPLQQPFSLRDKKQGHLF